MRSTFEKLFYSGPVLCSLGALKLGVPLETALWLHTRGLGTPNFAEAETNKITAHKRHGKYVSRFCKGQLIVVTTLRKRIGPIYTRMFLPGEYPI